MQQNRSLRHQGWVSEIKRLAACKDTSMQTERAMQLFEYPSVSYWYKEINGTLTGAQKN